MKPVAEDIVQDVLVRVYGRRGTLRDHSMFKQWLYQIARNAVIDYYRRRKKPTKKLPDELVDEEAGASENVEEELAHCVAPLVKELPPQYRQAVLLSEFEGPTQKEAASKLGLYVSGAKSRIQRARKMLEAPLLECCRLEFDGRGSITSYESKKRHDIR